LELKRIKAQSNIYIALNFQTTVNYSTVNSCKDYRGKLIFLSQMRNLYLVFCHHPQWNKGWAKRLCLMAPQRGFF